MLCLQHAVFATQEASVDPLGLLRDTKLQHSLPLASAYAALLDYPPTNEQLKRQRTRLDHTNREPLFTNFNRLVVKGGATHGFCQLAWWLVDIGGSACCHRLACAARFKKALPNTLFASHTQRTL